MIELKLRGYVTPEDFEGSDWERIQKALDLAKEQDICKVVLSGEYKSERPITVPGGMHLIFDNAVLIGDLRNDTVESFSFITERIYIEGKNSIIVGDLMFRHTRHLVLEKIKIDGDVDLKISRDLRIEYVDISGNLTIGRGCQNAIVQYNKCAGLLISGEDGGYDIIGRDPIIKSVLVRDSEIVNGVLLEAGEDSMLLNVQLDGIRSSTTAITLGKDGKNLPSEQYQHLTFANIDAPTKVVFNNECMCIHME